MIQTTAILALVVLLFVSFSHGLVTPAAPSLKNKCSVTTSSQLDFQQHQPVAVVSSEESLRRPSRTSKVTKLELPDTLDNRSSKRKTTTTTFAAHIRGKAMDLLLWSYEIDQMEYGI